jgi:hemoglobin
MTLFESIGGAAAVEAAVQDFYRRVLADPDLAAFFEGTDMKVMRAHQRAFLTAALGGPSAYTGRSLAVAHEGRGITDHHFDAVAGHLQATLAHLGVPNDLQTEIISAVAPLRADVVD